jgi:hypothetical protein
MSHSVCNDGVEMPLKHGNGSPGVAMSFKFREYIDGANYQTFILNHPPNLAHPNAAQIDIQPVIASALNSPGDQFEAQFFHLDQPIPFP